MKKKFFLVGAFVAIAMSTMFVACEKSGSIENGCTCTMTMYGYSDSETAFITGKEMKEAAEEFAALGYKIITCSDYSDAIMKEWNKEREKEGESVGAIKCK